MKKTSTGLEVLILLHGIKRFDRKATNFTARRDSKTKPRWRFKLKTTGTNYREKTEIVSLRMTMREKELLEIIFRNSVYKSKQEMIASILFAELERKFSLMVDKPKIG